MKNVGLGLLLASAFCLATMPAGAQYNQVQGRSSNPNLNYFYMARQQWDYVDQTPIIKGTPAAPGAAAGQPGIGAMPGGAPPLPQAGWQPYSQNVPSLKNNLPKVMNGVPPKPAPAPGINGKTAKAGAYKGGAKPQAAPSGPTGTMTYTPYKGYGSGAPAATSSATASSGSSTSANVSGTMLTPQRPANSLHWSRSRQPN